MPAKQQLIVSQNVISFFLDHCSKHLITLTRRMKLFSGAWRCQVYAEELIQKKGKGSTLFSYAFSSSCEHSLISGSSCDFSCDILCDLLLD